jgi:hypothetical protein
MLMVTVDVRNILVAGAGTIDCLFSQRKRKANQSS